MVSRARRPELSRLTGRSHGRERDRRATGRPRAGADLGDDDTRLLWLLIEGKTNREIASELEVSEDVVARRLAEMYARIGVSSRGEAAVLRLQGRDGVRMLRARVDRHRCIGAGNCITIAPTAFDWLKGELGKADVVDPDSVEEELAPRGRAVVPDRRDRDRGGRGAAALAAPREGAAPTGAS